MPIAKHHLLRRAAPLPQVIALCTGLVVMGGCGSSSPHPSSHAQRAQTTPLQSNPDVGQATAQRTQIAVGVASSHRALRGDGWASSSGGHRRAPAAGGVAQSRWISDRIQAAGKVQGARSRAGSEGRPTAMRMVHPCSLVSIAEAQAITGSAIAARIEAPLGPTCVYRFRGSKTTITLGVEALSLPQAAGHMTHRTPISVGRRHAYCGRLGTGMLFAPLRAGQVLNVTAPCGVARRFATLALSRLAL